MSTQNIDNVCSELTTLLGSYLSDGKIYDALSIIKNPKYIQCLKDKSWDLIPSVSKFLLEETIDKSPEVFDCCETILKEIAQKANPEEALLEFLEQAENFENDVKFLSLLKPLQIVLFKLPKRRGQSLEWCLNMIQSHVSSLPSPGNYKLDGEERKLMDCDPCVIRITNVYKRLVFFYEPFVNEVSLQEGDEALCEKKTDIQREMLMCYILQLLGRPLALLDLESCTAVRPVAEQLLNYLTCLTSDVMLFLEYSEIREIEGKLKNKRNDEDDSGNMFAQGDKVPTLCIGIFYYLLLAEQIKLDKVPCVYSPVFVFERCLYLIMILLRCSEGFIIHKGLSLSHAVLSALPKGSVPYTLLDSPTHLEFLSSLVNIMTFCEVEEFRKSAVFILRDYLFKFDVKGQYLLMLNLNGTVNHAGVRGFLIMQLKDMIVNTLGDAYFSGKALYDLIAKYCSLEHGAETDLVENIDQIISALNLIRFLVLRDRENKTKIWDYIKILEKSFFEPLREGIRLSRAHYQLKLKDLEEERANASRNTKTDVTITVGGQQLPNLPHESKVGIVSSALNAFDLMESLLSRVNECIEI